VYADEFTDYFRAWAALHEIGVLGPGVLHGIAPAWSVFTDADQIIGENVSVNCFLRMRANSN
jgi:hypothetical protein